MVGIVRHMSPLLDLSAYLSPRHGSNAWSLRHDVIECWRSQRQAGVPPMTMEWAPILACDAQCPLCPYNRSRSLLDDGLVVGGSARADDSHAASLGTAHAILDAARAAGIQAVLFTGGGEPLRWQHLVEALCYSGSLGMDNCLYTNGFRLGAEPSLAADLLVPSTRLAFVRLSINAVTPAVVKKHWGLPILEVDRQMEGLAALLRARNALAREYHARGRELPSIQISTIIDRQNVGDLPAICQTVAAVFKRHRIAVAAEDVMVVRPLTIHGRPNGYSSKDHSANVIKSIVSQCGNGSEGRLLLDSAGVPLFLGFGLDLVASGAAPDYSAVIEQEYAGRDVSWANGLFLTVGPDGTVYPMTEHNCDRAWAVGSLLHQTVAEVYESPTRRAVLEYLNRHRWGPLVAQPTSRTARLDRIAKAIIAGELTDAAIGAIADVARGSHRVMLD